MRSRAFRISGWRRLASLSSPPIALALRARDACSLILSSNFIAASSLPPIDRVQSILHARHALDRIGEQIAVGSQHDQLHAAPRDALAVLDLEIVADQGHRVLAVTARASYDGIERGTHLGIVEARARHA